MAKSRQKQNPYLPYPKYVDLDVGYKVSWYSYSNEADAKKAAEAAKWNAEIQAALGYDFGYCSPGSIEKVGGLFKVCIP